MCQLRFNRKLVICLFASLFTFFAGVGVFKIGQIFTRPNQEITETQEKIENIFETPKTADGATELQPDRQEKIENICEEIKNSPGEKARDKRYIEGGVLNGKSCFIEPIYPKEAIENVISEQVNVEVLVDGFGIVRSAKAISGQNELLRKSAVEAAYKTKIHPTMLGGEPMNVKGILVYKFSNKF